VRDHDKNTQLEVSIDERLAHPEKDLRWLKWGALAVFLLSDAGKAVLGLTTPNLYARSRLMTVARA
jgi:hypothetical protein